MNKKLSVVFVSMMLSGLANAGGYGDGFVTNGATSGVSASSAAGGIGTGAGSSSQYSFAGSQSVGRVDIDVNDYHGHTDVTTRVDVHGRTTTYNDGVVTGNAIGNNDAFAAQGGYGEAGAFGGVRDYSRHSHRWGGWYQGGGAHNTARATGFVGAGSAAAQGSVAAGSVNGTGESYQDSGAYAGNMSNAMVDVDAYTRHNNAGVNLSGSTLTTGYAGSWAEGNVSGTGTGASLAGAGQFGGASVEANGGASVDRYEYRRFGFDGGSSEGFGDAYLEGGSFVIGGSISGGVDNHSGDSIATGGAGTTHAAGVDLRTTPDATGITITSYAIGDAGSGAGYNANGQSAAGTLSGANGDQDASAAGWSAAW